MILGVQFAVTPIRFGGKSSVVAHENDNGIVGFSAFFQPVHQIAQTLVHAFDQCGVCSFMVGHTFFLVFVVETFVLVQGDVDGVLGHIQVERLVVLLGFVQSFDSFQS